MPPTATAPPDADGLAACIAGRAGLDQLSRERVRMELLKLLSRRTRCRRSIAMTEAGLLVRVLGGVPLSRELREHGQGRGGGGWRPTRCAGSARSRVAVAEDAERLWQRLRLANASTSGSSSMGEDWWRVSPRRREGGGARCSIGSGRERFADRVLLAWARSPAPRMMRPGAALASLPQRWTPPVFPLQAADFIARGVEQGPALGALCARPRRRGSRPGFRARQPRLKQSS